MDKPKKRVGFWRALLLSIGIGATGGHIAHENKDNIVDTYKTHIAHNAISELEEYIKNNQHYEDNQEYYDSLRNLFSKQSLLTQEESQRIKQIINYLLRDLQEKKAHYRRHDRFEYDAIVSKFEPHLKDYFEYNLNNLKRKDPSNVFLHDIEIKK